MSENEPYVESQGHTPLMPAIVSGSHTLTAVPVQLLQLSASTTFRAGHPTKVLDTQYARPTNFRPYDVSLDGRRFLMIKESTTGDPNATPVSLVVVLNWLEELKARVPTK